MGSVDCLCRARDGRYGRVGAVRTSIVTYLIPVVSAVLGISFRDETITVFAVAGPLVVLLGAWMSSCT